jgi:DNA (cytosine-5)-methyltransferase 1
VIDWALKGESIFSRRRPLAPRTLDRIEAGLRKFGGEPFIAVLRGTRPSQAGAWAKPLSDPLGTISAGGIHAALCEPFVIPMEHSGRNALRSTAEPLPTITTAKRGELAACVPILSKYHGQKLDESRCKSLVDPFNTLDTQPRYALVSSFIVKHFSGVVGVRADTPLPTTLASGCQNQIVSANLLRFNFDDAGIDPKQPHPTITSNNHSALVYSFLIRYFGTAIGQHCTEPLYTITGKDRFGLVIVQVAGEPYALVDIGMRMLTPRELARAQGFPDTYQLTGTKTNQVARIGNSVCPHVAKALAAANCGALVPA